jgi:hypothetical protein
LHLPSNEIGNYNKNCCNLHGNALPAEAASSIITPLFEMSSTLSYLSIALGIGVAASQGFGLIRPDSYAGACRKFPRSTGLGVALTLGATAWFLYYLSRESIADFAAYKGVLYFLFGAVGVGTCIFVRDLLAVRGLALVLMLFGKLMVDTGRIHLDETSWVLLIQTWAYLLVVTGMWLTISPWRLRDWIHWTTADPQRMKTACAAGVAFGLVILILGVTVFRNLG